MALDLIDASRMDAVIQDLRHAWRALAAKPLFLGAALATLTIGIGANIAIFSIVNAMLLRPLPFGDRSDRVVTVHATHRLMPRDFSFGDTEISYPDLLDLRAAGTFEGIGGYLTRNFTLSGDAATAERVRGGSVTPDLFPLLGIEPVIGRQFRPEEAAPPGLESVVMLTNRLWQRRYGADPAIVGRQIIVNERARTVIGVLPPGFRFPERDDLYVPFRWDESPRNARNVNGVAVRKAGVSLEQAQAEVDRIAARLAETYPETNRGFGVVVLPFRDTQIGGDDRALARVLLLAVGFVLLIVCANLANLMLVRGAARQRDVAVRAAMGASRDRLALGMLAESTLLAVIGAGLGLIASQWALDYMQSLWPEELPYWLSFDIDARVALFTAGATGFTAMAIGLIPAIRAARPDLVNDLKEASRGASLGRAAQRLQAGLAVAQVALCLALLVGANLMIRSFLELQRADVGFDTTPLLTARAYLAGDQYDDLRARAAFFHNVVDTLAALPGAEAAALTTAIPGDDGGNPTRVVADGRTQDTDEVGVQTIGITGGLFATLGLPIVDGRTFTPNETLDPQARVAVINRALAERLWPGQRALDHQVGLRDADEIAWFRIVGVVPDVHYEEIGEQTEQSRLNVYFPYASSGSRSMALMVRSAAAPETLLTPAREAMRRLSAGLPIFQLMTMSELRRQTNWEQRFFGVVMGGFAAAALLLACLGLYALIAYSIGRRSREIGVRLALGARPADVVRMLLVESGQVALAGTVAGVLLGIGLARALGGILYGVRPDGWLIASMLAPLLAALFVATWVPARRAARVQPTSALREG
jgi:predicted permease